jgi:hypothetical protein
LRHSLKSVAFWEQLSKKIKNAHTRPQTLSPAERLGFAYFAEVDAQGRWRSILRKKNKMMPLK